MNASDSAISGNERRRRLSAVAVFAVGDGILDRRPVAGDPVGELREREDRRVQVAVRRVLVIRRFVRNSSEPTVRTLTAFDPELRGVEDSRRCSTGLVDIQGTGVPVPEIRRIYTGTSNKLRSFSIISPLPTIDHRRRRCTVGRKRFYISDRVR
ncbi:hypothetical protein [Natronococcus jeotgali]|uniref:hypothetical protein n=1 Tax=Natronococcus jeotgali TaxID=413812 RepID=UPI001360B0C4|nr:hypothetical protein [Natronococcus jeotgali]